MINNVFKIYTKEINNIIKDDSVTEIFLVGSSKDKDFKSNSVEINDIDIFVFRNSNKKQDRIIETINGVDFDINYFSHEGVEDLIKEKEYFFLKEMKEPKIVYDKNSKAQEIIKMCEKLYNEGPRKLSLEEKEELKLEILSKIDSLKYKIKYSEFEFLFLTNICIKDLVTSYFRLNSKWIPKDKKLLKTLENDDKKLYELIKKVNCDCQYEVLLNAYKYIFKIN